MRSLYTPYGITVSDLGSGAPSSPSTGDLWMAANSKSGTHWLEQYDAGAAGWQHVGGSDLIWDSTKAGATWGVNSITTPTLDMSFKHLAIYWQAQVSEAATQYLGLQVNGDTAAHYYGHRWYGSSAAPAIAEETAVTRMLVGLVGDAGNGSYTGSGVIWIPSYGDSGIAVPVTATSSAFHAASVGNMWTGVFTYMAGNTSQTISSLTFLDAGGGNLVSGRISVYGVS